MSIPPAQSKIVLKLAPQTVSVLVFVPVLLPVLVLVAALVPAVPVSAQVARLLTPDSHQTCIYRQGLAQPDQPAA